jgi:hypothetical protein
MCTPTCNCRLHSPPARTIQQPCPLLYRLSCWQWDRSVRLYPPVCSVTCLHPPHVSHRNDMQHLCALARCTPQVHMAICACFWVCAHGVRVGIQVVSGVSLCFADLAFFFFFFPSSSPTSRVHHGPRPIFSFLFSVLFLLIGLLFLFFSFLFSFSAFCFLLSAFCFTFYFLLFTFFSFLFTFFSFTFCLTVLLSVFFFTLLLLYCFGFGVSYQIP